MMRTLASTQTRRIGAALAAALMLWATSAQALGLGDIEVRSRLNQRFSAAIPVLSAAPEDIDSLTIRLASAEEFARAGIERVDYLASLGFSLTGRSSRNTQVQLTSNQVVRDPFLNFIVEARWNGGRFLREYTVLLDPPAAAVETATPQSSVAAEEPAAEPALPPSVPPSAQTIAPPPVPAKVAVAVPDEVTVVDKASSTYGPVQPSQTLWSIAKMLRVDARVSMDQMLLAIYEANPAAFEGGINGLQAGSLLKVPTPEQALSVNAATATARVAALRGLAPAAVPPAPAIAAIPPPAATTIPAPAPEPVPSPVPVPTPAPEAAVVAEPPAGPPVAASIEPAPSPVPAESVTQEVAPPVATTAPIAPAEPPAVAAAVKPQPLPPTAASSTSQTPAASLFEELPWLLVGLLLLIILLLIFVIVLRRRKEAELAAQPTLIRASEAVPWMGLSDSDPLLDLVRSKNAPLPASADETPTVIAPIVVPDLAKAYERAAEPEIAAEVEKLPVAAPIVDEPGDETDRPPGASVDNGDPLTEADFHLAYGLYEEAEQGLKAAIAAEPGRNDLKLKLAEVYAASGQSQELPAGSAPISLLTPIPQLSLYDSAPEPLPEPEAETAAAPTAPIAALSVIDFDLDDDARPDLPIPTAAPASTVTPPSVTPAVVLPAAAVAPEAVPPAAATAASPSPDLKKGLNIDLKPDLLADIDLSNFDLEDSAGSDKTPAVLGGFTVDELDLDKFGDEDSDELPPMGDEIDTKLDLARAYADMGDDEAANTLLAEVMEAGNKQQRIEAKALKKRLKN